MTIPLGAVANIQTATIFREVAPKPVPHGNVHVVTIKDVVGGWPVDTRQLPMIQIDRALLANCLRAGEVLIPSRGDYYPARYFDSEEGNVFPVGQLNIIETSPSICGRYLAWYLNQPQTQQLIAQQLTGSNIKALNKASLQQLPIAVPPMATQQAIAGLQDVWGRKKALQQKLQVVQEQEIEALCRQLAAGQLVPH